MGNFEIEPPDLRDPLCVTSGAEDIAARLDTMLATLASASVTPAHDAHIRLEEIPFDALLGAIERARPGLDDSTEIAFYRHWLDANPQSPLAWAGWFNIATLFTRVGNQTNAATAYNNALVLRPDMHCISVNLGLLLEATNQPEQALATWQRATQPDAARIALQIQQGRLLEKLGYFEDAERILRRVLLTDPAQPDVVHHWVHLRQKTCLWPVAPSDIPDLPPALLVQNSGPLGILALTDDIDLQRAAAAAWVSRKTEAAPRRLAPDRPYPHARIRIGYMSSDFCSHAMSYLITELFERHDRSRFEIFGYCSSQEDGTLLRQRVLAAFDHHRMIRDLSDEAAAQMIRDDEIDILIDLNGITDGSRLAVLRWRPAPIQATYLGFIGPVPMPELDYLLADNVVIPPEFAAAYQPSPLAIAQIYQANDSKRTLGRNISRAEAGLPEDRFVFCCFTKHFKITETMFAAWMRILHQAERAVLWLANDNPYSQANLLAAAKRAGIAPERIIFSERADPDLYMSRLGIADLFLDTFPYNAGTVASDALRMGLPLLTLCGDAFASRMAASLLHTVGAPQGITTSLDKYVDTATHLANTPAAYAPYKKLFTAQAWNRTIGNIARFTEQFEDTWSRIVHTMRDTGALPITETHMDTGLLPPPTATQAIWAPDTAKVLHVGCGAEGREKLPAIFRQPGWQEIRLDIDTSVRPDFVSSITDMQVIPDDRIDAVYSSHNVEHLYPHEVPLALREMHRVLKPTGFTLIRLPDLQEVARYIAEGVLEDPLYQSSMGPIAPLDILFGHNASIASGNVFMAHRTGFTSATLGNALIQAGFAAVMVQRDPAAFSLAAIGFHSRPSDETLLRAQAQMLNPGLDAVLYTATAPAQAEDHFSFALRCTGENKPQDAIDAYCRAIALRPDFTDAYINLGSLLLGLGQCEQAATLFRLAIAISPGNAMAHGNLGKALQDLGRIDDALAAYRTASTLQPDNATVLMNFGAALLEQKSWDDSVAITQQAIALQPASAMAHANLGTALLNLGRYDDALIACQQAMALHLHGAAIHASLGGAMLELGDAQAASKLCRAAIALAPNLANAWFNLSHAHKALNQLDDAVRTARQAIALSDAAEYHFHLAHTLLLQGDFAAGWTEYECRWKLPDFAGIAALRSTLSQPQWAGESLKRKTILIYTEQGLGDIIQFARYLPILVRKAGRVIVAVHAPMRRLLATIEGITLVSILEPLPAFDTHCPLMSLPLAFATKYDSIPAQIPYLHANPDAQTQWAKRLGASPHPRVGIVWAGNPAVQRDRFRSPRLASIAPLFNIPNVEFVILQMGPGRDDLRATPLPSNARDLGPEITDLADTAAIMSSLDLVISSCTGPLHLAGALGVPVWAILPFAPHFPWLLEHTETRWYPTMRLYRQNQPGRDWTQTITQITTDLTALAHAKSNHAEPAITLCEV